MDDVSVARNRWRLALGLAALGLAVAAAFFAYFETDPRPGSPMAVWSGVIALFLCPGSLLFVTWIDIEPQTTPFVVMWLVIALINFALYGAIGAIIGKSLWKSN